MAHDEHEVCEEGDKVRITMSRPISKHKVSCRHLAIFFAQSKSLHL